MAAKFKYALVLSGGGFKGAFQVGAINYLNENWKSITGESTPMHFDVIAGVSVGSLNGAMLAMNKIDALNKLWEAVGNNNEVIYTSSFIDTKNKSDVIKLKIDFENLKKILFPDFAVSVGVWKGLNLLFSKKRREEFVQKLLENAGKEVKKKPF